jgi:hypothetical protein
MTTNEDHLWNNRVSEPPFLEIGTDYINITGSLKLAKTLPLTEILNNKLSADFVALFETLISA